MSSASSSFGQQPKNRPRWRDIRFDEIATGFVSTSDHTALFSRTLASFGPAPSPPPPHVAPPSADSGTVFCRMRFSPMPTTAGNNSNGGASSPTRGAGAPGLGNYGERAVIGIEVSSSSSLSLSSSNMGCAPTALYHLLLRADGMMCLKWATVADSSSSSVDLAPLDQLFSSGAIKVVASAWHPWADGKEDHDAKAAASSSSPFIDSSSSSSSSSSDTILVDASPHHLLWNINSNSNNSSKGVAFSPGSTLLIRNEMIRSAETANIIIRAAFLIFSASSEISGVSLEMSVPSSPPAHANLLSVECIAGQTESLCAPGGRLVGAFSHHHQHHSVSSSLSSSSVVVDQRIQQELVGYCSVSDSAASCAEFSADFIVAPLQLACRAPPLLLSAPSFCGSILAAGDENGGNLTSPSKRAIQQQQQQQQQQLSALTANNVALSEGFTTADVIRLAGSNPVVRAANNVPSYLSLRGEQCFERLQKIVDAL